MSRRSGTQALSRERLADRPLTYRSDLTAAVNSDPTMSIYQAASAPRLETMFPVARDEGRGVRWTVAQSPGTVEALKGGAYFLIYPALSCAYI